MAVCAIACALGLYAVIERDRLFELHRNWVLGLDFERMPPRVVPSHVGGARTAGSSYVPVRIEDPDGHVGAGRWHPVEGLRRIPSPHPYERAVAIVVSAAGHVAGGLARASETDAERYDDAFLWSPESGVVVLDDGGRVHLAITGIGAAGEVVGHGLSAERGVRRAIAWGPEGSLRELEALTPEGETRALHLAPDGRIVGEASGPDHHARPVIWEAGRALRDLGSPSGFTDARAVFATANGEVFVLASRGRAGSVAIEERLFLWREGTGFELVPGPDGYDHWGTLGCDARGALLLRAERLLVREFEVAFFLRRSGECVRLPDELHEGRAIYTGIDGRGRLLGYFENANEARRGFVARSLR